MKRSHHLQPSPDREGTPLVNRPNDFDGVTADRSRFTPGVLRTPLVLCLLSAAAFAQVPYDRIVKAESEPGNWMTYSGNYSGHRFSPLEQITPANVTGMHVKWAHQFDTPRTETSPLVVDGVMYITAPNSAAALDVRTGRELWKWSRPIPKDYQSIGFGRVNRGPGDSRQSVVRRHARLLLRGT